MTSFEVLLHELGHAALYFFDPVQFYKDINTPDPNYDDANERLCDL